MMKSVTKQYNQNKRDILVGRIARAIPCKLNKDINYYNVMKIVSNKTEGEAAIRRLAMKTDAGKYELEKQKKLLLQEGLNVHCDQKKTS